MGNSLEGSRTGRADGHPLLLDWMTQGDEVLLGVSSFVGGQLSQLAQQLFDVDADGQV
jgi:hypothetical protein